MPRFRSTALRSCFSPALAGVARIPGDKSISHRALMLAGLATGETLISGLLEGEDVLGTAAALRALGIKIRYRDDGLWQVIGTGGKGFREPDSVLDMGNSGTSTSLLLGLMAPYPVSVCVTGDAPLTRRPMQRVITPLTEMGAAFIAREGGRLPLAMQGTAAAKTITYKTPGVSAQVKSAVLLAGLNAAGETTVIEDVATHDHTENMLRHFGVEIETTRSAAGQTVITVKGGQTLHGCAIDVPGDPSSAAFVVAAALLREGSDVTVPRIGMNPLRAGFYETLRDMGADLTVSNETGDAGERVADLRVRGTGPLQGVDVPLVRVPSMIDEVPVLAMLAACARGTTRLTGLAELRVKESDRLTLIARGLEACGAKVEMGEDSLIIHGTGTPPKGGVRIETALDHRIAMSFLVLGLATEEPIEIDDAAPVATSFPGFAAVLQDLGARIEETDGLIDFTGA